MKRKFPKFKFLKVGRIFRSRNSGESSASSSRVRHPNYDSSPERLAAECKNLDQVIEFLACALACEGLGCLGVIFGIGFIQSNELTSEKSSDERSLNHNGDGLNPYEQVICIIGKTLAPFNEDNLIPSFGFGDASTHNQVVFSFYPDAKFCDGYEEVLRRYKEIVPHVRLSGPTSFAPIIEMAVTIVKQRGCRYHVLLIIADGEVGGLQEQRTVDAIVEASNYPLSIILIGVGDGPWYGMSEFYRNISAQRFDNFRFVNFTEIMSKDGDTSRKEAEIARTALMEIPSQYQAAISLNLLSCQMGNGPERVPLPPPTIGETSFSSSGLSSYPGFRQTAVTPHEGDSQLVDSDDDLFCYICVWNLKQVTFNCGHQTCSECSDQVGLCPFCREEIVSRTTHDII